MPTDMRSGDEVAGSTFLTISGGAHQFSLILLAALCEGPRLQLRPKGCPIAIWTSPKVGGLHDKSKDPYVGADWGPGKVASGWRCKRGAA